MPDLPPDRPDNGNPTPAEIFQVFRTTTLASIQGLRLLLDECADLRSDLVTVHSLNSDGDGDGLFSARQQNRILELQEAAKGMDALLATLPRDGHGGIDEH